MPINSECAFSHPVREALMRDKQLVRLLGGTNVFEGYEIETSEARINVCESTLHENWSSANDKPETIVTIQVWSHSGRKSNAHKLIEAAERALAEAGLTEPSSKNFLIRNFAGARKLPDSGEYHGILRYRVNSYRIAA